MAVKTYGIFIAYSPRVEMKGQGLGRYLAEFARAIIAREDAKLVIAAPSWSRQAVIDLFDEMDISSSDVEILSPQRQPAIVAIAGLLQNRNNIRKKTIPEWYIRFLRGLKRPKKEFFNISYRMAGAFASARNPISIAIALISIAILLPFLTILYVIISFSLMLHKISRSLIHRIRSRIGLSDLFAQGRISLSKERTRRARHSINSFVAKLILDNETERLTGMVNIRGDIVGWYVPTPFWPLATKITRPTLICVPDLVTSEFPAGFGKFGASASRAYGDIKETLKNGRHFVTYSEHIKHSVLVEKFSIDSNRVSVIRHAASRLDKFVIRSGFHDNQNATRSLHRALFSEALNKASGASRLQNFRTTDFSYIFYASQARPSKNITALLRAYEYLLRKKYIKTKLILTAHGDSPEIFTFVNDHDLGRDVLCLHSLSEMELAACYGLADLAVCPTLSEGGMPFTYTEAISVGTPVVMGRIAVTEEVMLDKKIQDITLFNPHDWKAMAEKIEWALANKDFLYEKQRAYFDNVLSRRSWEDVVSEHVEIMDRLALDAENRTAPQKKRWLV